MATQKLLTFLQLLLVVTTLCWGTFLSAQTKPSKQSTGPAPQQRVIVDAAGRVHVRNERIPFAQRKAAAKARVQALREAAAKRKLAEVKK